MRIHGKVPEVVPMDVAKNVRPVGAAAGQEGQPASAAPQRADRVQISDAGRARAAHATEQDTAAEALSPERHASIRQSVLEGAYNSVQVVDEVARRILARGDLGEAGQQSGAKR